MPAPTPAQPERPSRPWQLEDLFADPGARGRAEAAARFHGDTSARRALDDLRHAVADLTTMIGANQ